MKKIIHVGILSVGLMLSNAALADEFADMRNSPNNMTAEQAERVEAGFSKKDAFFYLKDKGKDAWNAFSSAVKSPKVKKAATGALYTYEAHNIYKDFNSGDRCPINGH